MIDREFDAGCMISQLQTYFNPSCLEGTFSDPTEVSCQGSGTQVNRLPSRPLRRPSAKKSVRQTQDDGDETDEPLKPPAPEGEFGVRISVVEDLHGTEKRASHAWVEQVAEEYDFLGSLF
jgi:hypothetical protein